MTTEIQPIVLSTEVQALLAQAAQEQGEAETSAISNFSIKGKKFSIGDEKLGTTINVVILADVFDHAYYDRDYDPDVVLPPACFALGTNESELAPNPSEVPNIQSDACKNCPKNEFGSSKNGKGKACRNGRRLLIASWSNGEVNLDDLAIINIPPTSLKAYSRYVKSIATIHKLPLWSIVTQLSFDEDLAYPSVIPVHIGNVNGHFIEKIIQSLVDYRELVAIPYDCSSYEKPSPEAEKKKSKMS